MTTHADRRVRVGTVVIKIPDKVVEVSSRYESREPNHTCGEWRWRWRKCKIRKTNTEFRDGKKRKKERKKKE
jgi:hypothetical protein